MFGWLKSLSSRWRKSPELSTPPVEAPPSLIRDLWDFQRMEPGQRAATKETVLTRLREGLYEKCGIGIDRLMPLHIAARGQGDVELVEALIESGHPVSPKDYYDNTPLVLAVHEQDHRLENNLPVINLLLRRSLDEDLLIIPSLFGGVLDLFGYVKENHLRGTEALFRERFKRLDIHSIMKSRERSRFEEMELLSQLMHYQGCPWKEIVSALKTRGEEDSLIWHCMRRLRAWRSVLEELKLEGKTDQEIVALLRDLQAHWADIAYAYLQHQFPSEEIVSILHPILLTNTDNKGTLSWMVAGAIDPDSKDSLRAVREILEDFGEDPRTIVTGMPYLPERKVNILTRMGLALLPQGERQAAYNGENYGACSNEA